MSLTGLTLARPLKAPAMSGVDCVDDVRRPVFIADLHLSGRSKRTLLSFWWFMQTRARRFRELFILGDFFEYWIGDDACSPAEPIARVLRNYAASGHRSFSCRATATSCWAKILRGTAAQRSSGRRW